MTDRKAVIKNADMSEDMQTDAVECATQAMEKFNIEKDAMILNLSDCQTIIIVTHGVLHIPVICASLPPKEDMERLLLIMNVT